MIKEKLEWQAEETELNVINWWQWLYFSMDEKVGLEITIEIQ
jgi:hypothetical protein